MIEVEEIVHVIHRRSYADEMRRHFVGRVVAVSETLLRVDGFAFVYDAGKNFFIRRAERRERIISLIDSANIVTILPRYADLETTKYVYKDGRVLVTDGSGFSLEINEIGIAR